MTTKVIGLESLQAKLKNLENPQKTVKKGMGAYVRFVRRRVEKYPPETSANRRPGNNGYSWYDRGFGTRTVTGRAYRRSQKMDNQWHDEVNIHGNSVRGEIRNEATYAPFVQGERQRWYHAMRGWKRVDKFVDATKQVAVREIADAISKDLNK